MAGFQNVRIQRFKNLQDTVFSLGAINVIVGSNNSGKSSILQALHFAVGSIQSLRLNGDLEGPGAGSSTINPAQLIYLPSDDANSLGFGGRLWEQEGRSIRIEFTLENGEDLTVSVRRGRNRNIVIAVSSKPLAQRIATLKNPFTIFTPGLAGIARKEQYLSDGVLLRTIARGDANLVLRNTLLRLWQSEFRNGFIADLHRMFPSLELDIKFETQTDEFIQATLNDGGGWVPLDLAGTGYLQTIQILAYIHYYRPQVIVLDEPDSHLHPNNQRLLCSLLSDVAENRDVQVILSTHSRHVIDALRGSTSFLWARGGTIDIAEDGSDLAILTDLGALDIKERISIEGRGCYVLTEDTEFGLLYKILESSGFSMERTEVLSYHGVTALQKLTPVIEAIRRINNNTPILVHKDRDYHNDVEITDWQAQIRGMRAEPFVTSGVDIESHFLSAAYISQTNKIDLEQAQQLLDQAANSVRDESIQKFINGRIDIEKKNQTFGGFNVGAFAVDAPVLYDANPARYVYGKLCFSKLRGLFQQAYGRNLALSSPSEFIGVPELAVISRRFFGEKRN